METIIAYKLRIYRDVNAAINILKRAIFGQSRSNAQEIQ